MRRKCARLMSARLMSARLTSARLMSARRMSARLTSARRMSAGSRLPVSNGAESRSRPFPISRFVIVRRDPGLGPQDDRIYVI